MTFNATKLSNNLQLVSFKMPHVQSVAINLIVKTGSRYEENMESGISHFLEHMAFKGTKTRSAMDIAKEFDAIGGHFNAYTSRENTVYHAKVLSHNLANALDIISDIIQNSVFNQADVDKELGVILQEIAATNDSPEDLAFEHFYELAYPNQPMGKSILGSAEYISTFNKPLFEDYMSKHYVAENMILSIAGDINHQDLESKAEAAFSSLISNNGKLLHQYTKSSYQGGYRFINKDLEQSFVTLGFESVSYSNLYDFYTAQMASLLLGGGLSSRLFQSIREELGLAYNIGSFNSGYSDSGLFMIYAGTDHKNVEVLLTRIKHESLNLIDSLTTNELDRAKAQVQSNIYMSEESSSYKSEEIGRNFALFNRYTPPEEVIDMVFSVKEQDISNMLLKILKGNTTLVIVGEEQNSSSDFNKLWQNQ